MYPLRLEVARILQTMVKKASGKRLSIKAPGRRRFKPGPRPKPKSEIKIKITKDKAKGRLTKEKIKPNFVVTYSTTTGEGIDQIETILEDIYDVGGASLGTMVTTLTPCHLEDQGLPSSQIEVVEVGRRQDRDQIMEISDDDDDDEVVEVSSGEG
jgi:hypothetical protein